MRATLVCLLLLGCCAVATTIAADVDVGLGSQLSHGSPKLLPKMSPSPLDTNEALKLGWAPLSGMVLNIKRSTSSHILPPCLFLFLPRPFISSLHHGISVVSCHLFAGL